MESLNREPNAQQRVNTSCKGLYLDRQDIDVYFDKI